MFFLLLKVATSFTFVDWRYLRRYSIPWSCFSIVMSLFLSFFEGNFWICFVIVRILSPVKYIPGPTNFLHRWPKKSTKVSIFGHTVPFKRLKNIRWIKCSMLTIHCWKDKIQYKSTETRKNKFWSILAKFTLI